MNTKLFHLLLPFAVALTSLPALAEGMFEIDVAGGTSQRTYEDSSGDTENIFGLGAQLRGDLGFYTSRRSPVALFLHGSLERYDYEAPDGRDSVDSPEMLFDVGGGIKMGRRGVTLKLIYSSTKNMLIKDEGNKLTPLYYHGERAEALLHCPLFGRRTEFGIDLGIAGISRSDDHDDELEFKHGASASAGFYVKLGATEVPLSIIGRMEHSNFIVDGDNQQELNILFGLSLSSTLRFRRW